MDAVDYWNPRQFQAKEESDMLESGFISGRAGGRDSDGSGSLSSPMVGTESSPLSGPTDTSATRGSPSYT
jgi:hypothetical protein